MPPALEPELVVAERLALVGVARGDGVAGASARREGVEAGRARLRVSVAAELVGAPPVGEERQEARPPRIRGIGPA